MATLGERIKAYRAQLGLSQKELAEACSEIDNRERSSWGQSRIANYEASNRMPDLEDISILANVLRVEPEILAFDTNITKANIRKTYSYPLISSIQAGMWKGVHMLNDIDGYEMISSTVLASVDSFYLKITGESMEPRFHEGDLVLIDPTLCPTPGKFIAAINGDDEATFKQYKQLGTLSENGVPHFELVPLNPMFPVLSTLNQEIRIIGVAVERRESL